METSFKYRRPVTVRFVDVDGLGHAHHAQALVYFEEARAAYWRDVAGRRGLDGIDYVMGEVSVRYLGRVRWPQTLDVGVRVTRLGRSRFDMEYEVRDEDGLVLLTGTSAQVMYDYDAAQSVPIPGNLRSVLLAFDAPAEAV